MSQHYSDPARASDPQALPDLEIVYVESGDNEGKEAAALADAMQ